MRQAFLAAATAAAIFAVAKSTHANGRFPASNQILFSPTNPRLVIVRNTFGIAISRDGGSAWYWLCEEALGLSPMSNEDPFLGITSSNSLVAGLTLGLQVSTDVGCNWTVQGGRLEGQLVKDLVVHRENPHVVDTITNTDDGSARYVHELFESTDDGATWAEFATPFDPTADVTTIEVAPSDPNRLYVSAIRADGSTRTASLFVSKDHGATWTEHQAPLDPTRETAVYIGGVDASNADIVYLRTEGVASRLIVTRDGGQTYRISKQLSGEMLGFALSQDGSKIYIGSVEDGLFVGDKATLTFVSTNPSIHVRCLATQGPDLWACSDEPSCFIAGVSHDDGKTFTSKMHLLSIQGPLECDANAGAAICAGPPFAGLCCEVSACYALGAGPASPMVSTCSCSGACSSGACTNTYNPSAHCPLVGGDASNTCLLDVDGGEGDSGVDSPVGGGTGGSAKSKGYGCGIVGEGGAFGFFAAGAIGAIAAGRRRRLRGCIFSSLALRVRAGKLE